MTEGPFFVDEKLNRSDLTADTQRPAVIQAAPLALTIAVYKLEADTYTPMPDVQVDVWHCDALGFYSDEDHPMNHEDTSGQTWLRGFQRSDADGLVHFQTIVPGWYRGRTPHIHFKVRLTPAEGEAQKEFTSQLFFNHDELAPIYGQGVYAPHGQPDQTNATDNVYGGRLADGSPVGDQMLLELVKQDHTPGYMTQLPILLTDEGLSRPRGQRPGGPPRD